MSHLRTPSIAASLRVTYVLIAWLLVPAGAVQARSQNAPPQSYTHEFQVILVRATAGDLSMPEVPADAVEALQDIVQVLRYRHFELIDTAWLRTDEYARARLGEAGSLEVELRLGVAAGATEAITVEGFELDHRRFERDPKTGQAVFYGDSETLLASSFGITVGETVVVGTSRANGDDEALIVLLKAVR